MNIYANLPPGNPGAAVDVSTMGQFKTITASAGAQVQYATDAAGTNFAPLVGISAPPGSAQVAAAATFMRQVGTGNVDVGANEAGVLRASLAVPVGNGVGAAIDVSEHGSFSSVVVVGLVSGNIILQISEDNIDYNDLITFSGHGGAPIGRSASFTAAFVRLRRQNAVGTILVDLCSVDDDSAILPVAGVNIAPLAAAAIDSDRLYKYDTTAGIITQPLPLASTFAPGATIWFKKFAGANNLVIQRAAGDTVDLIAGDVTVPGASAQGRACIMRDNVATNWILLVLQ
jgi:hypothetical protein